MITGFITLAFCVHAAAFICYPHSGMLGSTFTFVSLLIWTAFGILLGHPVANLKTSDKAGVLAVFAVACAIGALSLMPQTDGVSPLYKLADGRIPTRIEVYTGLLRLGINYPALLPPKKEEAPVI